MKKIELSLASTQLSGMAIGLLFALLSGYILQVDSILDIFLGGLSIFLSFLICLPIHALAHRNPLKSVHLEFALVLIRVALVVALSVYLFDNGARSYLLFAVGIFVPLLFGTLAILRQVQKDPRFYWITPTQTQSTTIVSKRNDFVQTNKTNERYPA